MSEFDSVADQRAAVAEANGETWPGTPPAATPTETPGAQQSQGNDSATGDGQNAANSEAQNNATPVDGGGEGDDAGDSAEGDAQRPGKNSFARKIDRLTREASSARAENEALRRLILQGAQAQPGQAQQPNGQQQARPDADPKPQREAFADYGDFLAETAAWSGRQEARKAHAQLLAGLAQRAQTAQAMQQAHAIETDFRSKVSEGAKEFKDFAEVTESAADVVVPDAMTMAIAHTDNPAAVLYWLAKNPNEVARIAGGNPARVPFEIARISANAMRRPAISNAPPPGKPVQARGGAASGYRDDMSMDDFVAMRQGNRKKA